MGSLTLVMDLGKLNLPNLKRRHRRLRAAPQLEKSGIFSFCHHNTSLGGGYILAEQRPVSVRTGGLFRAGERCSVIYWGRNNVLMFVRLRRLSKSRGALFRLFFCLYGKSP